MSFLLCLLALALPVRAAPADDLNLAAAADVPTVARQEAFDRLVILGSTDTGLVTRVAQTEDDDTRKRWVAVRVLGHVGGDGAQATLLGLLKDPQPAIRAAAVGALGELGKWGNTATLTAMLDDPAIIVRAEAASALAQLGDPTAVPALSKALASPGNYHRDTSLWVRKHYVVALGEIGTKDAVPALLRALDDADPDVAAAAIPAFEHVGGFSMGEGRNLDQQKEAWRRWAAAQVR